MTYRESTPLRVIKTRLALLPEAIRGSMLAAKFDANAKPPAMRLRGRLRPGLYVVLGLLAAVVTLVAAAFARFDNGNGRLVLATAAIGAGSLALGLVDAFRTTTFRLQFQAILLAPHWLVCTDGIGERVDLIPLVMVESITKHFATEFHVVLRERAGTLRYLANFPYSEKSFFDAVRGALPEAQIPPALPEALDRDVPPFTRWPSVAAAALAAVFAGLPAGYFALARRAVAEYTSVTSFWGDGFSNPMSQTSEGQARLELQRADTELEYFDRWRNEGGLVWWILRRATDVSARSDRHRARLDEGSRADARARANADETEVTRTTDYRELRRIATDHQGTPLGQQALDWIHTVLEQDLVNAAAHGASQEQIALCRQIRYAGELASTAGLSLALNMPSEPSDDAAFATMTTLTPPTGYATGAASALHRAFAEGLRSGVETTLSAALGIHTGTYAPPSPTAVVNVSFEPIEPRVTYLERRARDRRVIESNSYPSVRVTIQATLRATPAGPPIQFSDTYTGGADAITRDHLVTGYRQGEALYLALCEPLGRQAAEAILQRLCLH